MATEAETALNILKKLEANKTCVNCGNYNRFGHQNICEKVRTFVCSNCKSAHQSFSMRVKSVSMSNWTMDEVDALREQNGGGNAVAARVWYGHWDESQMRKPTKDDPMDYYKQFINRVYNDKAFYDEHGVNTKASNSPSIDQPTAVAPVTNLLDFDTPAQNKTVFDSFPASSSPSSDGWGNFAAAPAPVTPVKPNDGFGAFVSAPASISTSKDNFADFCAAPPPAPSTNEMFSAFEAPPPTSSPNVFDPFAVSGGNANAPILSGAAPDPYARPIQTMSGNIMSQFNTKDFSVFDGLSAPSLAYGTPQRSNNGPGIGMQRQQHMHTGMGWSTGMQQKSGMQNTMNFQQHQAVKSGPMNPNSLVGLGRPNDRDPFAGLGLQLK